jgi:hypothetical protein
MSTEKMNTSEVFEMFETINNKLDKRTDKSDEPMQIDLTAINTVAERLEKVIEEARKSAKVEHQHRHTIDIGSSKIFLSLGIMALTILAFAYIIGEQRQTISKYRDNDLKYRYIKMQRQTTEDYIYRLERQFEYRDSVVIVSKQVEKYERLVKEQAERIERARRNREEAEKLQNEIKQHSH